MPYYHDPNVINPNGVEWQDADNFLNSVTEDDEGKILGVENGKPKFISGSGSGGVFVVNRTAGENGTWVLDKTAGELFNAVQSNAVIMKYITDGDPTTTEITFLSYVSRYDDGSMYTFIFNSGEDAATYESESADDYPVNY